MSAIAARTLVTGGLSKKELLAKLNARGVAMNVAAEELFACPGFLPAAQPTSVVITQRSVADLGLPDGGTFDQICTQARAHHLDLCPLELGPHLRLQWHDQPEADPTPSRQKAPAGSVTIASPPPDGPAHLPRGFYLRRIEGVDWLRGYWSDDEHVWQPTDALIFIVANA